MDSTNNNGLIPFLSSTNNNGLIPFLSSIPFCRSRPCNESRPIPRPGRPTGDWRRRKDLAKSSLDSFLTDPQASRIEGADSYGNTSINFSGSRTRALQEAGALTAVLPKCRTWIMAVLL